MTLTTCLRCRKQYLIDMEKCPHCGEPNKGGQAQPVWTAEPIVKRSDVAGAQADTIEVRSIVRNGIGIITFGIFLEVIGMAIGATATSFDVIKDSSMIGAIGLIVMFLGGIWTYVKLA